MSPGSASVSPVESIPIPSLPPRSRGAAAAQDHRRHAGANSRNLAYTPNKLFIGGISANTTTETLRQHFGQYGRMVDAVVMQRQGRPRGFGFVTYEDAVSVTAVLAAAASGQHYIDQRHVDVKRAVPSGPQDWASNKIFVGGLPQGVGTDDLKAYFQQYGPIADAIVMMDRRTNRSRGFGFVRFGPGCKGVDAANRAIENENHLFEGKWVEVKRATPQELTPRSSSASMGSPEDGPSKLTPMMLPEAAGDIGLLLPGTQARSRRSRRRRDPPGQTTISGASQSHSLENDPSFANVNPDRFANVFLETMAPMKVLCHSNFPGAPPPGAEDRQEYDARADFLSTPLATPWVTPEQLNPPEALLYV